MALYLVRSRPGKHQDRNATQCNAYIVEANNANDARDAAKAASRDGESRPKARWEATELTGDLLPLTIQGLAIAPGEQRRGA